MHQCLHGKRSMRPCPALSSFHMFHCDVRMWPSFVPQQRASSSRVPAHGQVYYGVDPCGDPCREAQLAWLTADLAAANANRAAVPWVVAMSHYPFYCTGCYSKQLDAAYYESNEAELYGNANRTAAAKFATLQAASGKGPGNKTVTAGSDASIKDLMPILTAGKVDLYVGGHWHYCESPFSFSLVIVCSGLVKLVRN